MKNKLTLLSIVTAGILLTGCGGGGGSSSSQPAQLQSVSGKVVDGPIVGANVIIQCQGGNYGPVTTGADGSFTISNIGASIDLNSCTIEATGGNDGVNDFTNLTLKAPYSLAGTNTGINVTPITTLVSSHDGELASAKAAVAEFLEISEDKLTDNPNSAGNEDLLKKAIALTEIAQVQGKFIDLDGNSADSSDDVKAQKLSGYVSNDLANLDENKKAELEATLEAVNKSNSLEDIEKSTITTSVLYQLKDAFKISSFENKASEKANLEYLASVIVEANKKDAKYQVVTKYHIRKALTDISLVPVFSDDENSVLETSISDTLALVLDDGSDDDFKSFVSGTEAKPKTIAISDIEGFILFDADSYEEVLGDNQDKRRNYYAYSNKSNIANITNLINSNNYSSDVNDEINEQVGKGLGKLGLFDDALNHIDDTVLIPENRYLAFDALGDSLLELGVVEETKDALIKAYEQFRLNKTGKESSTSGRDVINIIGTIQSLEKIGKTTEADEVIKYTLDLIKNIDNAYTYQGVVYEIEKKAFNTYIKENDLTRAKTYAKSATQEALNIPTIFYGANNYSFAVTGQYRTAITAAFFKEDSAAQISAAKARELEALASYPTYYGIEHDFVYRSVSGDINTAISDFDSISQSKKDDVLNFGFASALAANDKLDKLFEYYNDDQIYSEKSDISSHVISQSQNRVSPVLGIELLGGEDKLKIYLDKMYDLIKSWNITDSSEIVKIYANWADEANPLDSKEGYLALAQFYKDLGEEDKVNAIVSDAIARVLTITNVSDLTKGIQQLFSASEDLGIDNENERAYILSRLKTAALASNEVSALISAANFLSLSNKKDDAKELLEEAYKLIPELGDRKSVV